MLTKPSRQSVVFGTRIILLLFACGVFSFPVWATGVLDQTFGSGGKVNIGFGGTMQDIMRAAALQPDGKILIGGSSYPSSQGWAFANFALARLNSDGSLDNSFGNIGRVTTDFNGFEDSINAVAVQPDGKIVVGGYRQIGQSYSDAFALVRYNADGSLDTTFGVNGKVATDFEESAGEIVYHLFVQSTGKIIAVGSYAGSYPTIPAKIAVVRYNSNGSLDSSFGTNGKFLIGFARDTYLGGASSQPDGKILITGYTFARIPGCVPVKGMSCETYYSFVARYNSDMVSDKKFGRRFGMDFATLGQKHSVVLAQFDGRVLVGATRFSDLAIIKRYYPSGRFDTLLGTATFPGSVFELLSLAQKPDGKIVGCGYVGGGNTDMAVALYGENGNFIGGDRQDFFTGDDRCVTVIAQPDGKILTLGSAYSNAATNVFDFAAVRYLDITP